MKRLAITVLRDKKKNEEGSCCGESAGLAVHAEAKQGSCCPPAKKGLQAPVTGPVSEGIGTVPKVSTELTGMDYWGMVRCRFGAFRTHYTVPPGLYAVGEPTRGSDVFVSANYKMSFDVLRRELKGLNAWMLVLDTKGVNVWCAAGKGTFGSGELIKRISEAKLDTVVDHRRIIVPQLGAVGVSAGEVKKNTGFTVSFGPVRAADISAYIRAGYKKTREMSTIRFSLVDRLVLTPMEINPVMKKYPWFAVAVLLFFGLEPSGILFRQAWYGSLPFLLLGLVSIVSGAFLTPLLLPFIPFRSFAMKGLVVGTLVMAICVPFAGAPLQDSVLLLAASWLFFPAQSSYIALQFTGAATFTGMSGVKKELKIGLPIYIGIVCVSIVLMILFKIREWGLA